MPLYEHVFMVRQDVSSQQVDGLVEQFKSVLEQNGGKVGKVESWGLKSLSYRVRKNRKAYYTLMNLDAPASAVAEVERQQRLNEDVIRSLTLKVDEHEDGPSAMMQKRDDRGDRGERRGGRFGDRDRGPRGDRPPRRDDGNGGRGEGRGRDGDSSASSSSDGDA